VFEIKPGDIVSQWCDEEEFDSGEYRWCELRSERPDESMNLVEVTRYLILANSCSEELDNHGHLAALYNAYILYCRKPDWVGDRWIEAGDQYWLSETEFIDPREWKIL